MEIKQALDYLIEVVKNSEEFEQYHVELARLKTDTQLYLRVCEYRKRCMALHVSCTQDSFEEVTAIRSEFEDVLKNKHAMSFMVAEQKFLKLIKDVNSKILEAAAIEVDFLQEEN